MKLNLKLIPLLPMLALIFSSCSKDDDDIIIYDYFPISINIALTDSQGNSLFDKDTPRNLLDCGIYATYEGKQWPMDNIEYNDCGFDDSNLFQYEKTRIYVPTFYGPYLNNYALPDSGNKIAALEFGPFKGGVSGTEEYTLHIPELNRSYECKLITETNKGVKYTFIVNGKECPMPKYPLSAMYTEVIPDEELASIRE